MPFAEEDNTTRASYFTLKEVARHNKADDCWVSIFHQVLDISPVIKEHRGVLTQPLTLHAGEDLSHWFDEKTHDVKKHIDPKTNQEVPFLPYGPFLHSTACGKEVTPWWKDSRYVVGRLTVKPRLVEIVNVLTQQRDSLEVCTEETIAEIQERYLKYNAHAASYTWKYLDEDEFIPLQMDKTLEENGIVDESEVLEKLDLDELQHQPILHL